MVSRAVSRQALVLVSIGWSVLLFGIAGCEPPAGQGIGRTNNPGGNAGGQSQVRKPEPIVEPEPSPPALKDVWPPKAVWVARMTFRSPEQVTQVMDRCCQAGFNTVLFQVRGEGTAYYPSRIEPWGGDYVASPPNFDPLAVACREAHRRHMALHAWVNVMPGWRGSAAPSDPRQLYNAHPDWFWYDQRGRRQPLGEFYLSLNPCLPEVRQYLVNLTRDIITRYPVDGLHLDYIRFPMDEVKKGTDYPYDARTLALYKAATGKRPQTDAASWSRWRAEQVTNVVRQIRAMQKQARPGIMLTTACGPDMAEFKRFYFQDGASWLRGGLVDAVFVMNYNTSTANFRKRQDEWRQATGNRMVVPGIGEYMHRDDKTTIEQVKLAKQWGRGVAVFSYQSLFNGSKEGRIGAVRWAMR